jgi:hypothetical protein
MYFATQITDIFFSQNVQTGAETPSLLLKRRRDLRLWGQVDSVQLTTCFHLLSMLGISGVVTHSPPHIHDVQNDFTSKFKRDIRGETSLGQETVTVCECNANWKVTSFSKTTVLLCSGKLT